MEEQPTLPVVIWSGYPNGIPESLRWFAYAVLHKGDGLEAVLAVVQSLTKAGGGGKKAYRLIAMDEVCPGKFSSKSNWSGRISYVLLQESPQFPSLKSAEYNLQNLLYCLLSWSGK